MDTEKLKKLLLTDEEINKTRNRSIPQANVKIPDFKDSQEWLLWCDREMCKAQILKLQQLGWKSPEEISKMFNPDYLNVKNMTPIIRAEARQQALKEVGEWLEGFYSEKVLLISAITMLKQGELPKE